MPLPPYIRRDDTRADRDRYQTVYADAGRRRRSDGRPAFRRCDSRAARRAGIRRASVTLHVGAGTFQPVRADDIREHHARGMADRAGGDLPRVEEPAGGGRVVAVGTTVVRSLESAAGGRVAPYAGFSDLFIYPGYDFAWWTPC